MFFFLSKVFYQLATNPLLWVSILWIIAALKVRWRKTLIWTGMGLLWFFSNQFIVSKIAIAYQPAPVSFTNLGHYECGLLLGGMTERNDPDSGHMNINADRLVQTVELYKRGHIRKVLISGGTDSAHTKATHNEALFIQERLVKAGISGTDILIETKARNTYENALFSKKILDAHKLHGPFLLITSAIHVPRSMEVYKHAGFDNLKSYPCNYLVLPRKYRAEDFVVPQIYALFVWQRLLKEFAGTLVYRITGKA